MRETVDTFLDADGNVVTNPKLAREMRRVILEDGQMVENSIWFATSQPQES